MRNLTFLLCSLSLCFCPASPGRAIVTPLNMEDRNKTCWHRKLRIFIWPELCIMYPDLGTKSPVKTQLLSYTWPAFVTFSLYTWMLWRWAGIICPNYWCIWALLILGWLFFLILNGIVNIESDSFKWNFPEGISDSVNNYFCVSI